MKEPEVQKKKKTIRVVGIQTQANDDPAAAIERGLELARTGIKLHKPDLVVLPECFYIYTDSVEPIDKWAYPVPGPLSERFGQVAKDGKCVLIYGQPEKTDEGIYNTAVVIAPDGEVIGSYRKTHLTHSYKKPENHEPNFFKAGNELGMFDPPFGRIGVMICNDGVYPEMPRALTMSGAQVIVWMILSYRTGTDLEAAHSACNQIPLIAANGAGKTEISVSCILAKGGEVKSKFIGGEGMLFSEVELLQRDYDRKFKGPRIGQYIGVEHLHRRPELYKVLTEDDYGL